MSTSEPGGYVGDIYFGNPDSPTQGTHQAFKIARDVLEGR